MSSSVCFFVCVFFLRERVVGARARATTVQQHREGERGWRGGWRTGEQPSAGTDHSTPVGLSTSRLFSQASAESPPS